MYEYITIEPITQGFSLPLSIVRCSFKKPIVQQSEQVASPPVTSGVFYEYEYRPTDVLFFEKMTRGSSTNQNLT